MFNLVKYTEGLNVRNKTHQAGVLSIAYY
jgi:hypothetical protein